MRALGLFAIAVLCAACSSSDGRLASWVGTREVPIGPPAPPETRAALPSNVPPPPSPPSPPFDVPAPQDAIVSIGRGERHACVVRASGAVDCWGQHRGCRERSCVTLPAPDPTVRRVPGVTDAKVVAANGRCVLRASGGVACLSTHELELVSARGVTDAIAIDTTGKCVIVRGGSVRCRRSDDDLQFRPIHGVTDAVALASSRFMTCAIRRTGTVACTVSDERFFPAQRLAKVKELVLADELDTRGCALVGNMDGSTRVWCFALGYPGPDLVATEHVRDYDLSLPDAAAFTNARQLAVTFDFVRNSSRLEAIVDGKIVAIDLRYDKVSATLPLLGDAVQHVDGCAVRATGAVACWGSNTGGVLAQPTTIGDPKRPPGPVVQLANVIGIGLGISDTWALTRGGQLFTWGGHHDTRYAIPTRVPLGAGPSNLVELAVIPEGLACVRSATGSVWCQRGPSDVAQLDTERVVDLVPLDGGVFALRADGRTEWHQIGRTGTGDFHPHDAPSLHGAITIAGKDPTCVLRADRTIHCGKQQIAIANASTLVRGDDFGCALHDERVSCWWHGYRDGIVQPPTKPEPVERIQRATDLAGNREYACAVYDGGRVGCWHFTDGKVTDFTQVLASGAIDVEVGAATAGQFDQSYSMLHGPRPGGEYACAIMIDRRVTCWGSNYFGELGDGSLDHADQPIGVRL